MNGLINATDKQLEDSSDSCERWAFKFAGLVILGLVAEFMIAVCHPEYGSFWERWGSVVADVFVAIGVAGEVLFGRMGHRRDTELQRRTKQSLSDAVTNAGEANDRATKAEVELARLQVQLSPRTLSKEQYEALQALNGKVSAVILSAAGDFETTRFSREIEKAMKDAGVSVTLCGNRMGLSTSGIHIVLPNPASDFRQEPLYSAFKNVDPSTGCSDRSISPLPDLPEIPFIIIGEKPSPPRTPPYVAMVCRAYDENGKAIK